MKTLVKQLVQSQLGRFGRTIASTASVPSPDRFLDVLGRHGIEPVTIFDIGVAYGTDWLYGRYPRARYHLIDPSRESLPHMQAWAGKLDAEVHGCALGSAPGTVELRTRETIQHATLLDDLSNPALLERYSVEMVRFDQLFPAVQGPALVKIDVEGFEGEVLKGMTRSLPQIAAVVVETSLNSLYAGGTDFGDLILFMRQHGFAFCDICEIKRRPFDGALHQMDAAFVRDDSPLRVKRWD